MAASVEIKGLRKVFGEKEAVAGLDLTIGGGEFFALLGVNGAGKTTTIKMLANLLTPTAGDAFLGGHSIRTEAAAVKRLTGLSPQETAVAGNLTVSENLTLMAELYGAARADAAAAAAELSARLSLDEVKNVRAATLSGGWQRRLSVAMALISKPEVLFLDEPTLGLDILARRELWGLLRELKGHITVILTTHYLEEAEALADRIGIMVRGKLVACDTAKALCEATGCASFEDAFVSLCEGKGGRSK